MAELDSKNGIPERKAIINSISNSIGPMLRQLQNQPNLMPHLALRCAQFFHNISNYCLEYHRNFTKEEQSRKTKLIKKQQKDQKQKPSKPRNKKQSEDKKQEAQVQKLQVPKKPLSAYLLYFQQRKPQINGENPNLNLSQLTKLVSQQWKQAPEEKKKYYQDIAEKQMRIYQISLNQYKEKYGKISDIYVDSISSQDNPELPVKDEVQRGKQLAMERKIEVEEEQKIQNEDFHNENSEEIEIIQSDIQSPVQEQQKNSQAQNNQNSQEAKNEEQSQEIQG